MKRRANQKKIGKRLNPEVIFTRALKAYHDQKFVLALKLCEQILENFPEDVNALEIAAYAAANQNRSDAADFLARLTRLVPGNANLYHDLGLMLGNSARLEESVTALQQAIALAPNQAEFHSSLALALNRVGKQDDATLMARRAVALAPDAPQAQNTLGIVLEACGALPEAIAAYKMATTQAPDYDIAWSNLAQAFEQNGQFEGAISAFERVLHINPAQTEILVAMGETQIGLGRFEDAERTFRQALTIDPGFTKAYVNLARIYLCSDGDVDKMTALLKHPNISDTDKVDLNFSLGETYDRQKKFDAAYRHFSTACRLHRKLNSFSLEDHEAHVTSLKKIFTAEVLATPSPTNVDTSKPIFIVGMPRSGSTLVEQIFASHSQVYGLGEVSWFEDELINHNLVSGYSIENQLDISQLADVAQGYLDRLQTSGSKVCYVTDKMLDNYLFLGFIHLALPDAKIIHTRRNPIDTCLSSFTRFFTNGMIYSFDQRELGRVYALYWELMEHWRTVMPGRVHDVHYEDMVTDPETETRRMLEYCGLDWEPACLNFFETKRRVRTASSPQVRSAIHNKSVERWRNYEPWLQPLIEELNKIPEFDY